jgi:DNA-directed RNA polymerase subunit RPC12/RpoP
MQIKRCSASECGRPFQVNTFGPPVSTPYELGKITCPNCGATSGGDVNSLYLSHALSPEQEERLAGS